MDKANVSYHIKWDYSR